MRTWLLWPSSPPASGSPPIATTRGFPVSAGGIHWRKARRRGRCLWAGLVLQPLAAHRPAVVRAVRGVARAPKYEQHSDRGQGHERENEGDLALDREHVEKSVSHSLFPLRPVNGTRLRRASSAENSSARSRGVWCQAAVSVRRVCVRRLVCLRSRRAPPLSGRPWDRTRRPTTAPAS